MDSKFVIVLSSITMVKILWDIETRCFAAESTKHLSMGTKPLN